MCALEIRRAKGPEAEPSSLEGRGGTGSHGGRAGVDAGGTGCISVSWALKTLLLAAAEGKPALKEGAKEPCLGLPDPPFGYYKFSPPSSDAERVANKTGTRQLV